MQIFPVPTCFQNVSLTQKYALVDRQTLSRSVPQGQIELDIMTPT
jgi:hypothetical protein